MNLRHLCHRIVSSMLALGVGGLLAGLGTHSASAQSITVTTPFSYCVNNRAYASGEYKFTLLSQYLLSIRNVNGGGESLFLIRPEDGGDRSLARGPVESLGGVTFRTFQGFKELHAVHEPVSNLTLELIGHGISRDKLKTGRSLVPINCFSEKSSIRDRNTVGQ
jgi:hypothetical protein